MLLWQVAFSLLILQGTHASDSRRHRSLLGHHGAHHQAHTDFNFGVSRQGQNELPDLDEISQAGERCVEKVMMVEETTYDDQIVCHHSYSKKCHNTYITAFEAVQMEVCDDIFEKYCVIEYKKMAEDEEVEICNEHLERQADCADSGPTVCEKVFESECATKYHVHEIEEDKPNCTIQMMEKCRTVTVGYTAEQKCDKWPQQVCSLDKVTSKRTTPETKCEKKSRDVCGPGPCPLVKGDLKCRKVVETIVHDVPEEKCDLVPKKDCKFVTKQIPYLKPTEECVDIPKEVCVRAKVNPRKIKKPIVKKWCYTPKVEEGLVENQDNDQSENESDQSTEESEETTELPDQLDVRAIKY